MKKLLTLILFCLLCLFLSGISWAGHMGGPEVRVSKKVTGTISEIDINKKTIALVKKIDGREFQKIIICDTGTKITKDNAPKTIADLKKGDDIIVIFYRDGDNNIARSITIGKE